MKEDIRMMKSSDELGENNKSIRESRENTQNHFFNMSKCLTILKRHGEKVSKK